VVITSAAGHPLDLTFYQTIKGLTAAQHIAKPGGRILILGECAEGVGSPEFAAMAAAFSSYDDFLEEIGNAAVEVDQWQLEKLALAGQKYELFFYIPGITNDKLGNLAPRCFANPEAAVAAVLESLPVNARVALVPEGPYVFARVEEEVPQLVG
jgi:nickel-dependent lactate racemase